jgi:hypothetical protein
MLWRWSSPSPTARAHSSRPSPAHQRDRSAGQEGVRPAAKALLREIQYAESRAQCEQLREEFAARYRKPYPKAVEILGATGSGWWPSIASRRIIGFICAPPTWWNRHSQPCGWLRTDAARRYKKVANAEALIWKSLTIAEKKFPRFNSPELLEQVNNGQLFEDGIEVEEMSRKRRAAWPYLHTCCVDLSGRHLDESLCSRVKGSDARVTLPHSTGGAGRG